MVRAIILAIAYLAAVPCAALIVQPDAAQELVAGLSVERTLSSSDEHVYLAQLEAGAAIIAEADQEGVDLVIDVYNPAGQQLTQLDSPNGTQGAEPINFTALQTGTYKFVVHMLNKSAPPGKYVMKVERVLSPAENARRLAKQTYPTQALYDLWEASQTDPKAVENFIASRKGKGPIIEEIGGDSKNVRVTYLYYGDENTQAVRTSGGPHAAVGGILMTRFLHTPLFFASEVVPNDARYRYGFAAIETRYVGQKSDVPISQDLFAIDALNPEVFGGQSVLTMPAAPAQSYIVKRESVPQGKLTPATLKSLVLKEDRTLTIYTPPGYDGTQACDLLIVFDGVTYGGGSEAAALVPTPTILNNLIAAKKINPTVAVLVDSMGKRNRDLTGYAPFADFIGKELVPWARKNYRISPGASHVVAAGSSFGGLGASYCAFMHPEAIGNVLSQSGSYWVTKGWQTPSPYPYAGESGDLIGEFRNSKRLPIRFYMEIGRFDSAVFMLPTNRELRDVLLDKGYQVTYHEFDSGHDYVWWRGSLADGLISLLGRK